MSGECEYCGLHPVDGCCDCYARRGEIIDAMMDEAATYFGIDPKLIDEDPLTPEVRGMMEALLRRLEDLGAFSRKETPC